MLSHGGGCYDWAIVSVYSESIGVSPHDLYLSRAVARVNPSSRVGAADNEAVPFDVPSLPFCALLAAFRIEWISSEDDSVPLRKLYSARSPPRFCLSPARARPQPRAAILPLQRNYVALFARE